ncbi:hypothetical protein ACP70R_046278 [Stipagrostis hirtigluma subsp. patula]
MRGMKLLESGVRRSGAAGGELFAAAGTAAAIGGDRGRGSGSEALVASVAVGASAVAAATRM